ncbi:MAG TPA: alpha/beta hydrolase, partial [Pseudomonadales bacterium]|nr:alpha/beta hydrolase [Pseudomonadales bacterium]
GTKFPGIPKILFGHSMGSMLSQQFIETHGDTLDAVILSGSPGFTGKASSLISRLLVRFERWRLGPDQNSNLLNAMIFGSANKPFAAPGANGFEWLSRDTAQVSAYIDDPACGFVPCTGALFDMFKGATWTQRPDSVARIPGTLPVMIFSGKEDPVHGNMKNIERLLASYSARGLNVTTHFYAGGRHEMLNETNRDEVIGDVIGWLDKTVP